MRIKYHVRLTNDERTMLEALIKQEKPKVAQHKKRRAGILLAIDENESPLPHEQVAKAFRVRPVTICRLRQRYGRDSGSLRPQNGYRLGASGQRVGGWSLQGGGQDCTGTG